MVRRPHLVYKSFVVSFRGHHRSLLGGSHFYSSRLACRVFLDGRYGGPFLLIVFGTMTLVRSVLRGPSSSLAPAWRKYSRRPFLVVSQLLCKIVISRMLWLVRLLSCSRFWSPLFRDPLVQGQPGGFPRLRVIFWGRFYPSSLFLYFLCQSSTLKVKKVGYYPTIDYDYQNW